MTEHGFTEEIPPNEQLHNYHMVYLNGTLIGVVPNGEKPTKFVEWIRDQRGRTISHSTGVSIDYVKRTILINTDAGRLLIPLIPARFIIDPKHRQELDHALAYINTVLEHGPGPQVGGGPKGGAAQMKVDKGRDKSSPSKEDLWQYLLDNGFVELYDPVMVDNVVVAYSIEDLLARRNECTHLQLPCEHCGIIMAIACACNMSRGARNIYMCNHWKQGIGNTIWNPFTRYLGDVNLLRGAQVPLVRSAFQEIMGIDRYPFCQNVDVAYLAYAKNQDDALLFNIGPINRGAFVAYHIEAVKITPESPNAAFGVPDFSKVYAPVAPIEAYSKVDPTLGTPKVLGQKFKRGDVIAAITKPLSPADIEGLKKTKTRDGKEISYTLADESILHMTDHCPNELHPTYSRLVASFSVIGQNERMRLLQFATTRYMKAGDKFASEHAQKGICGGTLQEWEVPYNEDGIRATIVFNPPSAIRRETHGQIIFALLGKICALYGTSLDSTPFLNQVSTEQISGLLSELGMDPRGTERMYDPTTGLPYANPVFFGTMAYMRLKRMVDDLVQYRYGGPREQFSRMAVKGRVKHGGVMFDEMTRVALTASGANGPWRDCMFTQAAPHESEVCDKCHQFAYPSPLTPGLIKCDRCGNIDPATAHTTRMPYNALLLSSILGGAGCSLQVFTDSSCPPIANSSETREIVVHSPSTMEAHPKGKEKVVPETKEPKK